MQVEVVDYSLKTLVRMEIILQVTMMEYAVE